MTAYDTPPDACHCTNWLPTVLAAGLWNIHMDERKLPCLWGSPGGNAAAHQSRSWPAPGGCNILQTLCPGASTVQE